MRCECRCTVPFGAPVEPEEYSQKHMSSRQVGAASAFPLPDSRNSEIRDTTCFKSGQFLMTGSKLFSSGAETKSARAPLSRSWYS